MKKYYTAMKAIVMVCIVMMSLMGCKKFDPTNDDDALVENTNRENGDGDGSGAGNYYGGTSSLSPGTYYISSYALQYYEHFYQINANPEYPGNVLCGPTSYMLAAHMIAAMRGVYYPVSKQKVGAIYTVLSRAGRFDNASGMYIHNLVWFNEQYDYPTIKTTTLRTLDRTSAKSFIEYAIHTGFPVLVTLKVYGTQGSSWPNDVDKQDQSGRKYYVGSRGTVGHYIVLIGIKINADGSGQVYYKDPLSSSGETRTVSYTRLLDAMKANSPGGYFNGLQISYGNDVDTLRQYLFFTVQFYNIFTPCSFLQGF